MADKKAGEKSASGKCEAYCVKCKAKKFMKDAKQDKMANGRDCVKGKCPDCGTSMFKIGKM